MKIWFMDKWQEFLDWWFCRAETEALVRDNLEVMNKSWNALMDMNRRDAAQREETLIAAHRKCHAELGAILEKQQSMICDSYKRLEAFSEKIRTSGRTVEADRLMEVADTLLWALEGKVGKFYYERNANDIAAQRVQ